MKTKTTIKALILLTLVITSQACTHRFQAHCPTYGNKHVFYTRMR